MDRGAWQATVHEVTRVGQDLATKRQQRASSCLAHKAFSSSQVSM